MAKKHRGHTVRFVVNTSRMNHKSYSMSSMLLCHAQHICKECMGKMKKGNSAVNWICPTCKRTYKR